MLNLDELERRLDEALAKETSETMNEWLLNLRRNNLESFLGVGSFIKYKSNPYTLVQTKPNNTHYVCTDDSNQNTKNEIYSLAA